MRAETGLGRTSTHAAQGAQHARKAEEEYTQRLGQRRRETVEHHGAVVEQVGREAVHFALGFERGAEPVGKQDGGDATHGFLQHGKEKRGGWRGGGVADADAWKGERVES